MLPQYSQKKDFTVHYNEKGELCWHFILENYTRVYIFHTFIHILAFALCPCNQVFLIRENIFLSRNLFYFLGLLSLKTHFQGSNSIVIAWKHWFNLEDKVCSEKLQNSVHSLPQPTGLTIPLILQGSHDE
jgi:hypothetical protein